MNKSNNIQDYPTADSPNNDAFEGSVELYYELKGYITSSGKWFWKMSKGKQQRGYQDIDVLAVNGEETIIVSVSSNFDDKLSYSKGVLNIDKANKTNEYFTRVIEYLKKTKDYNWLTNRKIRKVIAVINSPKKIEKFEYFLLKNNIEILKSEIIFKEISEYLDSYSNKGLKIQNQTLRTLQILNDKKITIANKS